MTSILLPVPLLLWCCFFMLNSIYMCTAQSVHRDSDEEGDSTRSSVLWDTETYMSDSNMEHPDADMRFPSI